MSDNQTKDASTIIDPIDRLEYLMRAKDQVAVMDWMHEDGEVRICYRRRGGDPKTAKVYTGLTLRDAVNNLWEHERP